jgi:hypothetical protein
LSHKSRGDFQHFEEADELKIGNFINQMKEEVLQLQNQDQQQIIYTMEVFDNPRILFMNATNELLRPIERINMSTQHAKAWDAHTEEVKIMVGQSWRLKKPKKHIENN